MLILENLTLIKKRQCQRNQQDFTNSIYLKLCEKKMRQFQEPTKPTTNTAKRKRLCKSKPNLNNNAGKKDKPILETCKSEPEFLPTKKTKPKEKAENLKTCLLKTRLKTFLEETPPLKT